MVFDELVKKFELKVRACGWIILLIIEVECVVAWYAFLVLQEPSWSVRQIDVVPFTVSMTVIVSTTNVGWRRSCWDSSCTTPDWWWFLSPTRHSLVNCCLFLSTRSTRSFLMGAAWLISWQRPPWSYPINWCHVSRCCRPKQLMSMLSTCHYACILYSNRLMIRVDFSEPPLCGCMWC